MKISEYIKKYLIEDIKKVQDMGLMYQSFTLMFQGIMWLGKTILFKNKPSHWTDCFREVMLRFFDKKYPEALALYQAGIEHILLFGSPLNGLELCERRDGRKHLTVSISGEGKTKRENLNIVAEDFYDDLVVACNKVLKTDFEDKEILFTD